MIRSGAVQKTFSRDERCSTQRLPFLGASSLDGRLLTVVAKVPPVGLHGPRSTVTTPRGKLPFKKRSEFYAFRHRATSARQRELRVLRPPGAGRVRARLTPGLRYAASCGNGPA